MRQFFIESRPSCWQTALNRLLQEDHDDLNSRPSTTRSRSMIVIMIIINVAKMMTLTMVMMMIALMMTKEGVCCCLMSLLAKVSPQTAPASISDSIGDDHDDGDPKKIKHKCYTQTHRTFLLYIDDGGNDDEFEG